MATASTPGWYDDPDGKRRWWSGSQWGAYAPWGGPGDIERPAPREQQRPKLDGSLTFDPTASGRAARAGSVQPDPRPPQPSPMSELQDAPAGKRPRGWRGGMADRRPSARARAATHRVPEPGKRVGTATVLLVALGLLGGHRFYLGLVPSATVQMMLSFAAAAAVVVQTDAAAPLWLLAVPAAAAVWWISDLARLTRMVRAANRRRA